ncbi:DUF397 domain-containing protein [Streptomyces atratus]|uniref:DUF397 domain-containing protein n=1 Tax=Streptomyces atratus TaxID=1893 RepID=UPI00225B714F|nr:DUF397 domain-containing protein [Streptomyces atratus]MCX5344043.1 DUF397 domain-containing protein [Streptomyces atratus]
MRHTPELSTARWRKSSYSNSNGGECVEIADDFPGIIPVRDSKNPTGPALLIPTSAWNDFIASLK